MRDQFISNQHDLLEALADGGLLFNTTIGKLNIDGWWLKMPGKVSCRVLSRTARAVFAKGFISPGARHMEWKITDEGWAKFDLRPRPKGLKGKSDASRVG